MLQRDRPSATGWIGKPLPRQATRRLIAGRGQYLDDARSRNQLHVAFLRSPLPHASFHIVDATAAMALVGVKAVLTADDLASVCRPWRCVSANFPGLVSPEQGPLAREWAVYQGEAVAMVLAETRAIAEDAIELLEVEWEELPSVTNLARALTDAPLAHLGLSSNLAWSTEVKKGEVDAIFAGAALVV